MKTSPVPKNETERIAALHLFQILDTDAEKDFDGIVELASRLCQTPYSLITLIDENRQWFKAKRGIELTETNRDISICAHTIYVADMLEVTDTIEDDRFFDNPFVSGEPNIRFYAGMPLLTEDGFALGTLCVLDQKPRKLTPDQLFSLRVLARQVENLLKLRLKVSDATLKLSAYFNSTTDIIFLLGLNCQILAFNKLAQDKIKHSHSKQVKLGDHMPGYIEASAKELFKKHFLKALSGEEIHTEVVVPHLPAAWLLLKYLPVYNAANQVIGVAFTSTDITKQKKAEQKVKRSFTQKEFIAQLGEAVSRAEKINQIYDLALKALQKTINVCRASVLLFDDDGIMHFKASVGLSDEYIKAVSGHSPWKENEKDALPIYIADVQKNEYLKDLLPAIQKEAIYALGFIPLIYQNRLIGKFMLYFNEIHEFNKEEMQLAESIARHVAYAIGQKKSELTLRESEQKYRDVVNSVKEIIFKTDVEGILIFLNPAWTATTGFTAEESIGRYLIDFAHPDDHATINKRYKELIDLEIDYCTHELRLITKDGTARWFKISKRLLKDHDNRPAGTTGILNDITEHKAAEKKLAENQRFLQTLINNLPGYVYRVKNDPTYTPEYISEGVTKITGHTVNEYLSDRTIPGNHSISSVDKERIWNEVQDALASHLPYELTYRMKNIEGTEKWVWERGQGIWNEEDELTAIEGFITDINDRKIAEEALQKSKDNLRTVFENTEVGYVLLGDQLEVLSFNKPAEKFTLKEYGKQATEGSKLPDYFPSQIRDSLMEVWASVLKGNIIEYDRSMPKANDKETWYHIKYSPISNTEKKTVGIVMSIEDITERKKAEIELNKSFNLVSAQNKRLLNFSYIVSHNLRSHATNIKAILNLMEDTVSENERKEMMQHLKTVSNSLDETLYNLNEVISIQNNVNLVFEPLNLNKYISKAVNILSEQIFLKNVMIKNDIATNVTVNYNPAYLESIILNFLSNAVKYSHSQRQPVILLSCFYEGNKPVLTITDNGVGIDLKRHGDKLFGMYKTFHGNTDARGLGLFISKSQIEFMGGRVEVESELNEGSTFKIYF